MIGGSSLFFWSIKLYKDYESNQSSFSEGSQASQVAASHQSVDLVCSLVGVDCFHVGQSSHHVVFVKQTIASTDLAAQSADFSSSFADPCLGHGDLTDVSLSLVDEISNSEAKQKNCLSVCHNANKLLLNQLET